MTKKVILAAAAVLMLVTALPVNAQTTLLTEDFEAYTFPPTGWTRINGPVYYGWCYWYRQNWGSMYQHGSGCAGAYYLGNMDGYGVCDDWLISPNIDLSGYSSGTVLLGFNSQFRIYDFSPYTQRLHYYVKVSDDGGSNWDEIYDIYQDNTGQGGIYSINIDDAPNPFEFDISGYIGENIQVAFHSWYNPPSGGSWYYVSPYAWSVDDVWVTHQSGGGSASDLAMKQIIRPNSIEEGGVGFYPKCKIENPGDEVVDAEVRCRIKDMSNQQTVYEEVHGSYPLDPGFTDVSFDRLCELEGNKMFEALFVVTHPGDENEQNNDMTKQVNTEAGTDISATAIIAPSDTQVNAFSPQATFEEMAGTPTTADLHCKIENLAYADIVFEETKAGESFDSLEVKDVTFSQVTGLENADYIITFWATDDEGTDIGAPMFKVFSYTGIVEEPVISAFDLKVSDNKVSFSLGTATEVNLRVYDAAGNLISVLASGNYNAGTHTLNFDAPSSGVYFFKLTTPTFSVKEKAIVLH